MKLSDVNTEPASDDDAASSCKSASVASECVVVEEETSTLSVGKYVGQCKWFNDLLGYGFVTVCDGQEKGKDIFVHHSGIMPLNSNYRTLKKGEYLNFNIVDGLNGLQAVDVTGINGGPLMCDFVSVTRNTSSPHSNMTYAQQPSKTGHRHITPTPNNSFVARGAPKTQAPPSSSSPISPSTPINSTNKLPTCGNARSTSNPYQAISNALGSQWYVVTKSGRKKNLAKYSKEGRMLMKQAKEDVMAAMNLQHQR